jgi:hypothetical protein
MGRYLDEVTLRQAAQDYAGQFLLPTIANPHNAAFAPIAGRGWVLHSMERFHFEDEFKFFMAEIRGHLGPKALKDFDDEVSKKITPYEDGELAHELATRLAITPDGKPIPGKIGTVKRGSVVIGFRFVSKRHAWVNGQKIALPVPRQVPRLIKADIHAGERVEEAVARATALHASHDVQIFPMSQWVYNSATMMALATRISNEAALGACDYVVDRLDEGTGAAIIRILDGTQATDPDTAIGAQVTLAQLTCSDPAFGSAADANPGGRATASAITSDSSADATGTASWFRASATNDGATSLDDHIDGSVGTSGCDMNLNTASIVSGATVSLSSWTVTMPES